MAVYKLIKGPFGSYRILKDNKMIAKKNIPANIWSKLENMKIGESISDDGIELTAPIKSCIFCGEDAKLARTINAQTIYLCDEHYYSKTVGQIVQHIRESSQE